MAGDTVATTFKSYQGYLSYHAFAADIGEIWTSSGKFLISRHTLTYARTEAATIGIEQFPVAAEPAAPDERGLALAVYPNPAQGTATARFSLDRPQRVRLAVYDVLGRRVRTADLGALPAGETAHRLDLAALPAGVYVVRLAGDAGAQAVARVVRQE